MVIIRMLDKTSTAKMLTSLSLPSLADLIVLSGFLSLETPSSSYITYSYGYHQKAWQKPALLKCVPCRVFPRWLIWSHWVDSFRWQHPPCCLTKPALETFVFFIYDLFIWLSSEGLAKPALRKCLPSRVYPRWLIWSHWVDSFRWKLRFLCILPIHMVIIRRLVKTSTAKVLTVSSFAGCFIVLSGFLPLATPPSISSIHMAIIKRHDKTLLKCLPCCVFPRWLFWLLWVDSFRWKLCILHKLSIHMVIIRRLDKASTAIMLTLLSLPSLAYLIVLSGFLPLTTPPSIPPIHMATIRKHDKISTAKRLTLLSPPSLAD